MTNTTETTHRTHLESRDFERTSEHRAVCSCSWTSDWHRASVNAVDAGLDHTAAVQATR